MDHDYRPEARILGSSIEAAAKSIADGIRDGLLAIAQALAGKDQS